MASTRDEEEEWDKDTDEINEFDSDELFEARPNRWRGPRSSWRTATEDDRLTFTALNQLQNQELSIHLYNAFALKEKARTIGTKSIADEEEKVH